MNLEKVISYFYYIIARCDPSSNLRLFGLNKIKCVRSGENCYLGSNITITPFGGGKSHSKTSNTLCLKSGNRVSVSPNVSFRCSMNPEKSNLFRIYRKIKSIMVEDDVWIGTGAIVLSGVKLHRCCAIGAGSVVTKDIPDKTVVAGVPTRYLKDVFHLEGELS